MHLLKFKFEEKSYFLHDGEFFTGGSSKWIAETRRLQHAEKCSWVGGMDVVEVSPEELEELVGKPYGIIDFTGGHIPFYGVEIKEKDITNGN